MSDSRSNKPPVEPPSDGTPDQTFDEPPTSEMPLPVPPGSRKAVTTQMPPLLAVDRQAPTSQMPADASTDPGQQPIFSGTLDGDVGSLDTRLRPQHAEPPGRQPTRDEIPVATVAMRRSPAIPASPDATVTEDITDGSVQSYDEMAKAAAPPPSVHERDRVTKQKPPTPSKASPKEARDATVKSLPSYDEPAAPPARDVTTAPPVLRGASSTNEERGRAKLSEVTEKPVNNPAIEDRRRASRSVAPRPPESAPVEVREQPTTLGPMPTRPPEKEKKAPAPPPPPPSAPPGFGATMDIAPMRQTTEAGLDEPKVQRLQWVGISVGILLVVSFAMVWFFHSGGPGPANVSPLKRLGPAKTASKADILEAESANVALQQKKMEIFIEETVDAGEGLTRVEKRVAGTVKLVTNPDSVVWFKDRELGPTPVIVTLPAGKQLIRFENKKIGLNKTIALAVPAHERTSELYEFFTGWLEVQGPEGSKVSIDGAVRGTVPFDAVQVYEGRHRVDVVLDTGEKLGAWVEAYAGQTVTHYVSRPDPREK